VQGASAAVFWTLISSFFFLVFFFSLGAVALHSNLAGSPGVLTYSSANLSRS